MTRYREALDAAARGWPVFPLRPHEKVPALRGWDHEATTDRDRVRAWWARRPWNIGISCGAAGLLVVDLDLPHGREAFARRAWQHGAEDPRDTYTVATAGGGEHRYFVAPEVPLGNTVGRIAPQVDTRGVGGYVVAAGSRVGRGRYRVLRDLPVAPVPGWLVELLAPPPPEDLVVPVQRPSPRRVGAYRDAVLAGELDRVRGARPGVRAHVVFTAACRVGELVGAGWLDERTAVDLLLGAASGHNGVEGWSEREALHHVDNGIALGRRRPRVLR
ncbi:bifunctional DNA primase/polymerase [Saccharothrix syringae]|uniref:Bifunctional DNA primase/polymerase n=1 Tax=Saccharothrix syringae TaxID=103733 RepID=A0A5Q0H2L6_SACSY|nr:bifunctional DNA primase/polymerase [Saccharothrix syringae]QFZ20155.1 bifunctional DNA primase/polymerase [Saccharothrix syringae]